MNLYRSATLINVHSSLSLCICSSASNRRVPQKKKHFFNHLSLSAIVFFFMIERCSLNGMGGDAHFHYSSYYYNRRRHRCCRRFCARLVVGLWFFVESIYIEQNDRADDKLNTHTLNKKKKKKKKKGSIYGFVNALLVRCAGFYKIASSSIRKCITFHYARKCDKKQIKSTTKIKKKVDFKTTTATTTTTTTTTTIKSIIHFYFI